MLGQQQIDNVKNLRPELRTALHRAIQVAGVERQQSVARAKLQALAELSR